MAVPRNRLSNSRKNTRRSHHAKSPATVSRCENCSAARRPHTACTACGQYAGRQVMKAKQD